MSIIETIDNAIRDCDVSPDAMRWTPDASAPQRPVPQLRIHIDMAQFEQSMRAAAAAIEQYGVAFRYRVLPALATIDALRKPAKPARRPERIRRMHSAYRLKTRRKRR